MLEGIQDKGITLHSVLIVRDGYLLTEAYFNPYHKDTPHPIQSITKSVIGALIGIAVEQGYIRSIKQPMIGFFSDKKIANLDWMWLIARDNLCLINYPDQDPCNINSKSAATGPQPGAACPHNR